MRLILLAISIIKVITDMNVTEKFYQELFELDEQIFFDVPANRSLCQKIL